MNARHPISDRRCGAMLASTTCRKAFTMVELLIVIGIIIVLMGMMVALIGSSMKTARAAATSALIQKIDNLLDERVKGFDRATKSADFQRIVAARKRALESGGIFGVSPDVLGIVARKDFFRSNFPQRFEDLASPDANTNGVPDILESVPGVNVAVLATQATPATRHATESSELLYYMLTRMQVFGVPPVGESEFGTSEFRDTDGDGLLEFVDGWGNPLRFYRWPTRLLKPNGILGADNQPGFAGVDDNSAFNTPPATNVFAGTIFNNVVDDALEFGKVSSDDITISTGHRAIVAYFISGLPSGPVLTGQWDSLSEDPDDPYGLISTEIKRLLLQSNGSTDVRAGINGFNEMNYPTIDTYHTPLIVSAGADGVVGLFEPFYGVDSNGDGVLDADLGILAQPRHGDGGPYDITSSSLVSGVSTDFVSALTDNITNRSQRAGKGK